MNDMVRLAGRTLVCIEAELGNDELGDGEVRRLLADHDNVSDSVEVINDVALRTLDNEGEFEWATEFAESIILRTARLYGEAP